MPQPKRPAPPSAQRQRPPRRTPRAAATPERPAAKHTPFIGRRVAHPAAEPDHPPTASATPVVLAGFHTAPPPPPGVIPVFFIPPIPPQHQSPEADAGRGPFDVPVLAADVIPIGSAPMGGVFPEWVDVDDGFYYAILEGVVEASDHEDYPGPDVSFEDLPISHYTHDFNFAVRPDPTTDNRYTNLLGVRVMPDGSVQTQRQIDVEWETGLGASNDGNVCSDANKIGNSAGFYSAGHLRRDVIWQWPTLGDRVHVEGRWIWDRGHPPARTEIHPPRIVAVQRHLPDLISTGGGIEPGPSRIATRIDLFASGDGGALYNNRGLVRFAKPVAMAASGPYAIDFVHPLAPPSMSAQLAYSMQVQPGDTFPAAVTITPIGQSRVRIVIPWEQAPDTAVLARTIWLYWDLALGIAPEQLPRVFNVHLNHLHVHNSQDVGNGEYRVFVEAGGKWFFVNELQDAGNILDEGLGDTGDDDIWGIDRNVQVCVLPGDSFRVHAGGWEADGANDVFGHLLDPDRDHDQSLIDDLNNDLLSGTVYTNGGEDDPIGETNSVFGPTDNYGVGPHEDTSRGPKKPGLFLQDTDPNGSFTLHYEITELNILAR
jgi:hypothetical protein